MNSTKTLSYSRIFVSTPEHSLHYFLVDIGNSDNYKFFNHTSLDYLSTKKSGCLKSSHFTNTIIINTSNLTAL